MKNPIGKTPEGEPFDPKDWELHIKIGDGTYFLGYDHMVDLLVSDGDTVVQGQPLGRASPASIRHGGIQGQKPIDEFEWGLRRAGPTSAVGVCPFDYLKDSEQKKLLNILSAMPQKGFTAPASVCLAQEAPG